MSEKYLPLYRKYRPQTFYDLIGQENIVKSLSNAIELGKISHAYLLCGPRGTGKTSSARILAKSLNCSEGPTLKPCGKCPSCIDITNSTPIDVIEIDAASNRKVEDARNILEKIQFVPVNGKYKIYIIDEVHMLTTEAFNTLLKTLEEPPENVIFILATTEPHKVLETIISRCQRFDFRRITTEDIIKHLETIAQKEKINISAEALAVIARSSAGGMRDSLALLDQLSVMDAKKEITADDVNEMLGRLSFDTLFDLSACILNSDSQAAIILLDKIYNNGNEPYQIISNLILYFRNMLIVKNCSERNIAIDLTQLSEQNVVKLKEQSENFEPEQLVYLIERLSFYSKEIRETTNRYMWLELCLIELSSNVKFASYTELISRIETLESKLTSMGGGKTTFVPPPSMNVNKPVAPIKPVTIEPAVIEQPISAQPEPIQTLPPIAIKPEPQSEPAVETVEQIEPAVKEDTQTPVIEKIETETEPIAAVEAVVEVKEIETPNLGPKEEPVVQEQQPVVNTAGGASNNGDLAALWGGILQNIESVPSRMFFYNLSQPVSLDSDRVLISFAKEIFVKQAKEDSKNLPLKKAAMTYFNVDDINIQVNLADANDAPVSNPNLKQIFEKKTEHGAEPKPPVNEISEMSIEEENAESLQETLAPVREVVSPANYSDQTKMALELFNGKIID